MLDNEFEAWMQLTLSVIRQGKDWTPHHARHGLAVKVADQQQMLFELVRQQLVGTWKVMHHQGRGARGPADLARVTAAPHRRGSGRQDTRVLERYSRVHHLVTTQQVLSLYLTDNIPTINSLPITHLLTSSPPHLSIAAPFETNRSPASHPHLRFSGGVHIHS